MKGDANVIDYLNRSLASELRAINQYWLHYRLLEDWGYGKLAAKAREESMGEMRHADRFVERILFLQGHPNLQTLDPLRIGQNLREVLECDLAAEHEAHALYKGGRDACHKAGDYASMRLFEDLIADEEMHIDFLETQLRLLDEIGPEQYGLLQATDANGAE